jgi:malate synthase
MNLHAERAGLRVAPELQRFIEDEALPGSGVEPADFWAAAAAITTSFTPRLRALLAKRDELQEQIDADHREHPGRPDPDDYRSFLNDIGYLLPTPVDVTISTAGVDAEITEQAGPQLVVPLLNARFATNAANARWGSLYDALYGSDAIPETGELAKGDAYNAARGAAVMARGRRLLDEAVPLVAGSHADAVRYSVGDGEVVVELADGSSTTPRDDAAFVGYRGERDSPEAILFVHHGLHLEVQLDRAHPIGAADAAGVSDIVLESAVTTIMDLEDSVAAVDAEDKVVGYRNWLLLNRGELTAHFAKGGRTIARSMHEDRRVVAPDGGEVVLHGRSLLFIRHVGHHMFTDAMLDADGNEVAEGILDALVTVLGSLHDLRGDLPLKNSRTGSIYVVKPKQHGPDEVAVTVELFEAIERAFGLPPTTIKIGVMDEERRTTLNLMACIAAARDRLVFINTGFLDRTGDEIHTSLHAGPFLPKRELKRQPFLAAYEDANVDAGLAAGLPHRAQIGKGMWAMPGEMHAMLEQKIAHPRAGATTAWVPSPTAATLHALHYHEVDVFAEQERIAMREPTGIEPILRIPLADDPSWSIEQRRDELDDSVQSILGYVVRWVDQGIGCSTVPDLHDVGLMEDRATLRISSQFLANWLTHGIITEQEVDESLRRIAPVVDRQNAGDPAYEPLIGASGPGLAFEAARDLIVLGAQQPNGYTEPILHRARRAKKAATAHHDGGTRA